MLTRGSTILSIWSGINFLLASLILTSVVIFNANSPLLVMVFEKPEIAGLDARVIASLNTLTILYNSCSMALSVLVWLLIRKSLIAGQKWAFWALLFVIGFVEVMAFIASAGVGNARWQVNVRSERSVRCGHQPNGPFPIQKRQRMTRTRLKAILVSHYGAARHASHQSPCFSGSYSDQRLQGHSTPRRSTRIQGRATAHRDGSIAPATQP